MVHLGRATQSHWVMTLYVEVGSEQGNGGALHCRLPRGPAGPRSNCPLPRLSARAQMRDHSQHAALHPRCLPLSRSLGCSLGPTLSLDSTHMDSERLSQSHEFFPVQPHFTSRWFRPLLVRLKNLLLTDFRKVQFSVFWLCFLLLIFSCL